MWAMMEKLRMLFINKYSKTGLKRQGRGGMKYFAQYKKSAPNGALNALASALMLFYPRILPDFRGESPTYAV
jgi:hypothetical protein